MVGGGFDGYGLALHRWLYSPFPDDKAALPERTLNTGYVQAIRVNRSFRG